MSAPKSETATAAPLPNYTCPTCRVELETGSGMNDQMLLHCPTCGNDFPVRDGVVAFCGGDEFYEGKWTATDQTIGSMRNLLIKKERFFVQMLHGKRGTVLDLGCAGGWRLYTTVGPVAGIDLSLSSLKQARTLYGAAARAELGALPFPDNSFDFVVSSDLLGHLPLDAKDQVLGEIMRVLKPGGQTLHYIEADSRDPLMRFAKQRPDLYDQHIVQPDGHIGMETPLETFRRFRRVGFKPIKELDVYKGLTYVGRVVQYFDNEYASLSRPVAGLVSFCKLFRRNRVLEAGANVVVSGLIELGDVVLPFDWAGGVLVCYEKVR